MQWLQKNWKMVAILGGAICVVLLIVVGWEVASAAFAGIAGVLGFGKKGRNDKPRGRKEALGETDKNGFKQVEAVVSDDPAEGHDLPSGVDEDDVDTVITTKPTVTVEPTNPDDRRTSAKKNRDLLKRKMSGAGMILLLLHLLVPAGYCADPISLTVEEAASIDHDLMLLQSVQEGSPIVEVKESPKIFFDEDGRVFTTDRMIFRVYQPALEGNEIVYDYTLLAQLHSEVEARERKPSWWEANDFKIGVVGGVVITVGIGAALGALLK